MTDEADDATVDPTIYPEDDGDFPAIGGQTIRMPDGTSWTPHPPGYQHPQFVPRPFVPTWSWDGEGNLIEPRPMTELSDLELVDGARLATRWASAAMRHDGLLSRVEAANNRRCLGWMIEEAARRDLLPGLVDLEVASDLAESRGQALGPDGKPISLVDLWAIYVRELRGRR